MKNSLAISYAMKKRAGNKSRPMNPEKTEESIEPDGMPKIHKVPHKGSDILKGIMMKKMSAGGMVDEDDFLSEDMPEQDFSEMTHLDDDKSEPMEETPSVMSSIMDKLRKRHYGK